MYIDTKGIILRKTNTVNNRRMIVLFSKRYGKISAGTSISEKGRNKASLAIKPFTYGRYDLYKNRDNYNINGAETIRSYYQLGEDVDKYANASYALEFISKVLPEELPQPKIFNMTVDFLEALSKRKKEYTTILMAYLLKAIKELGYMPQLSKCGACSATEKLNFIDIKEGTCLCENCAKKKLNRDNDSLICEIDLSIIKVMKYLLNNPFQSLQNIALEKEAAKKLKSFVWDYSKYHLEIEKLNSEIFLLND